MMRKPVFLVTAILISVLVLAGCGSPEAADGSVGSLAWIDAPVNGSILPLEPYNVVLHATGADDVVSFELRVNDSAEATIEAVQSEGGDLLWMATYGWLPAKPGDYTLTVRAQHSDGSWGAPASVVVQIGSEDISALVEILPAEEIGDSPEEVEEPGEDLCTNLAAFAGENLPEGSVVEPGEVFTKTWILRNEGTCTWSTAYSLVRIAGPGASAPDQSFLDTEIRPGEEVTLRLSMTAPQQDQELFSTWMLANPEGQTFGFGEQGSTALWCKVQVQIQEVAQNEEEPGETIPPEEPETPAPEDTVFPSLSVSTAPNPVYHDDGFTVTVSASDNAGIKKITIVITPQSTGSQKTKTCTGTTTCTLDAGNFAAQNVLINATVWDTSDNQTSLWPHTITIHQRIY